MLRLATTRVGGRPRICILPTASGDTSEQIGRFYSAFGERPCEPSDLSLFRLGSRPMELRDHLLEQDLIYVDGGGLLWEGTGPPSAVTAQRGARAYRVAKGEAGVIESPLPARFLTAPAPAALREDIAEFRRITAMRKRAGWLG